MNTLKAEKRSMDVKAKRLRREGYVTGNVFGREIKGSIPVKMDKLEVDRILAAAGKGSQVMLDVEGEKYDVLIKEIDYNTLTRRVEEIDFQALVSNEKVHSVAEIVLINHDKLAAGVGDTIRVKDLEIAGNKDIDILTDLDTPVVTVTAVHNVVPEAEAAEEEGEEAAK